jgi:hypothetical protein
MKSVAELEQIAIIATENYLTHNTPLNESIVKLAQTNNLNREQINRVVEAANTNVYVKLFNESNNKYIEFPNADSEKIASVLNPPKEPSVIAQDYYTSPAQDKLTEVPIFPEEKMVPQNSSIKEAALLRDFYKLAAQRERINNALLEVDACFEQEFDKFISMVKQAVLRGVSFEAVQTAIETVMPDSFIKAAMKTVHATLKENKVIKADQTKFEKTSSVNINHPLLKKAEELLQFKKAYITLVDKADQNADDFGQLKQAGIGSFLLSAVKEPKGLLVGAGAGAIVGIGGYKKIRDNRERQLNSPLQAIPQEYKRNA